MNINSDLRFGRIKDILAASGTDFSYATRMTTLGPTCEGEIIVKHGGAKLRFEGEYLEDDPTANEDDYVLVRLITESGRIETEPERLAAIVTVAASLFKENHKERGE